MQGRRSATATIIFAIAHALASCTPGTFGDLPSPTRATSPAGLPTAPGDADPAASDADPTPAGDSTGPIVPAAPSEVCDGFDNDGDGEIDEDLDGETCVDESGAEGTIRCDRGRTVCIACMPGEERVVPCGCGPDRIDVCGDNRTWQRGSCLGCAPESVPSCDRYDACEPGDVEIRRCDLCEGEECGVDCIGARWQCDANCEWQQITPCQIQEEPQCGEDDVKIEACGRCGQRRIRCDGCFWIPEPCEDEGVCNPGEATTVACDDKSCTPGFYRELSCNAACEWEEPPTCNGCIPGTHDEVVECVAGADCGVRITRVECDAEEVSICGGTETMLLGHPSRTVLRDDCRYNECQPGQVDTSEACVTERGECGSRSAVCNNSCDWTPSSECAPLPGSCVPGTVDVTTESCNSSCDPGASLTITKTCRADGCGWSTQVSGSCPCTPGQTRSTSCTAPDGRCGNAVETCSASCDWTTGSCTPKSYSCVPGTTETSSSSCGANACGASITETRTCRADGCGWSRSTSGSCPACEAGDSYTEDCVTSSGQCGTRQVTCSSSCEYQAGSCSPSPNSCTPGSTQSNSCSAICGLPGHQTFRCAADGCGWSPDSTCQPDSPPSCTPGQSQSELCPGCQTAQRERSCTNNCEWSNWTSCPPCQ